MNILYSLSAYLCFILFFVKIILHISLDNGNGYDVVVSPVSSWVYFLPYDKDVSEEFKKRKEVCNKIQKIAIYSFCICISFLLLKAFLSKKP